MKYFTEQANFFSEFRTQNDTIIFFRTKNIAPNTPQTYKRAEAEVMNQHLKHILYKCIY